MISEVKVSVGILSTFLFILSMDHFSFFGF